MSISPQDVIEEADEASEVTETIEAPSEASERRAHKKRKHTSSRHRKVVPCAPPCGPKNDGGLVARMFGVPGSTPGCTAGAYATEIEPDGLPDASLAASFPEHADAAKEWLSGVRPFALSLLLARWGPEPYLMDRMNRWLIRRVGRKCAEGTEEGRKDMAAFAAEAIRELRGLPPVADATVLYRAVPWSAMGGSAPGSDEFCEDCNIVWPVFASLVKSEQRARELLESEGGFLFVVEASQARDVTALAPVQSGADEIMLEPNSEFTIQKSEQQGRVLVVTMHQNFPSTRPIMREIEHKKHRHSKRHHSRSGSSSATASGAGAGSYAGGSDVDVAVVSTSPSTPPLPRAATTTTPVVVKAPPAPSAPPGATMTSSGRAVLMLSVPTQSAPSPSSSKSFRAPSRLSLPFSAHFHRRSLHRSAKSSSHGAKPSESSSALGGGGGGSSGGKGELTMTMWSAGKAYLTVRSVRARDQAKIVHIAKAPAWATALPPSTASERRLSTSSASSVSSSSRSRSPSPPPAPLHSDVAEASNSAGADSLAKLPSLSETSDDGATSSVLDETSDAGSDAGSDVASPAGDGAGSRMDVGAEPGFDTMDFAPNTAPTFFVTRDCLAQRTVAAIAPQVLLRRIHNGTWRKQETAT